MVTYCVDKQSKTELHIPTFIAVHTNFAIAVLSSSCLEPMDCLPTPLVNSTSSDDDKIEDSENDTAKNNDINMESCTNPPTPASAMQVNNLN